MYRMTALMAPCLIAFAVPSIFIGAETVPQFEPIEITIEGRPFFGEPYREATTWVTLLPPEESLSRPGSGEREASLFWDGGTTWRLRFAPDLVGEWSWHVDSNVPDIDGRSGRFECVPSNRHGGLGTMTDYPHHFAREDGARVWFLGDTAWALMTDNEREAHDRDAAFRYLDARATQGFNAVHVMLLSEAGWGNTGGDPFHDMQDQLINPKYWQEVDRRVAYANSKRITVGLVLAWGNKGRGEKFAWDLFPDLEARKRYARYIAARYSAYDVYFIVSGEWHARARTHGDTSEEDAKQQYIAIGNAIRAADPHGRMIAIHPMTAHGSVREFVGTKWMSFGDYQQNYRDLHARVLESRTGHGPVVNSEYGYLFRDRDGDGTPDKDNSTSVAALRHATWDIVMAGGYVVTGFGTTYFGGNRDPEPFDLEAEKNDAWERQVQHVKTLFTSLEWWKLEPHDELITTAAARGADGRHLGRRTPPAVTFWALAEPGGQYVFYGRGHEGPFALSLAELDVAHNEELRVRHFNPRTGRFRDLNQPIEPMLTYRPDGREDWVVVVDRATR